MAIKISILYLNDFEGFNFTSIFKIWTIQSFKNNNYYLYNYVIIIQLCNMAFIDS